MGRTPPAIAGILETPVYVDDLDRADRFYGGVLGLERMIGGNRLHAFSAGPAQTLLVCLRGATDNDAVEDAGTVPGHRGDGPAHFAFRIDADDLDAWRRHLEASGIAIYSTMRWKRGGQSLYFNDPDGNVLELATPGLWPNY